MMQPGRRAGSMLAMVVLTGACAPRASEVPLVPAVGKRVEGGRGVVSASHPAAAAAGVEVLAAGGNAADAAAAVGFALAVVDPSQTGLGGGGAATIWQAASRRADVLQFYARSGSDPRWGARDTALAPSPIAGASAGVPGAVQGLLDLQAGWGRLTRAQVLAPAIKLARDGFTVSPLLSRTIASGRAKLAADPASAARFLPGGEPLQAGDRLVQPDLAQLLEAIAREGREAFYGGAYAAALAATVQRHGGLITSADLASYATRRERPLCGTMGPYRVLGAGQPMGGLTVLEALTALDLQRGARTPVDQTRDGEAARTMAAALRMAQVDGRRFGGDPAAGLVTPTRGLTHGAYVAQRLTRAVGDSVAADAAWAHEGSTPAAGCAALDPYPAAPRPAIDAPAAREGEGDPVSQTSHLSVVDGEGNAVALTYTVGVVFGSGVNVGGVFLNSGGGNFSPRTRGPSRFANSTIAPTVIVDARGVRLVLGAGGSQYIPTAVTQVAWRILALGADPWLAIASPRLQPAGASRDLEMEAGFAPEVYAAMRREGYRVVSRVGDLQFGGVHLVYVTPDGRRIGAADPRRDGMAAAQ
jgi:gamma-glutamyltranspeptidase/glutathione hydrolase